MWVQVDVNRVSVGSGGCGSNKCGFRPWRLRCCSH
uniref:Uncharacterized protein n=1 Tax=Anguilla anguilla TaxID=7936 RepID=A0A0E9RXW5_ANGAN